jgi:predicted DNA binding CopG/RHH family protein
MARSGQGIPDPGGPAHSCFFGKPKKFLKTIKKKKMETTNKEEFKKIAITVKFSNQEFEKLKEQANIAGLKPATYCREIALAGYIVERPKSQDLNEIREFRQLLMEYKTNFTRISNLIRNSSPGLFKEVEKTAALIQSALSKYQL